MASAEGFSWAEAEAEERSTATVSSMKIKVRTLLISIAPRRLSYFSNTLLNVPMSAGRKAKVTIPAKNASEPKKSPTVT